MLLPGRMNFTIWRGATFRQTLTYYTEGIGSDPVDLTDYTAELTVWDAPQGDVLLVLTDGDGITLGDVEGVIEILLTDSETEALSWVSGVYELLITAPLGGDTDVILHGGFSVKGAS